MDRLRQRLIRALQTFGYIVALAAGTAMMIDGFGDWRETHYCFPGKFPPPGGHGFYLFLMGIMLVTYCTFGLSDRAFWFRKELRDNSRPPSNNALESTAGPPD
jgi:hypothetical protein